MNDVEHMDDGVFDAVKHEVAEKIVDRQHAHILQQRVPRRMADAALGMVCDGIESDLHGFEPRSAAPGSSRAMKA